MSQVLQRTSVQSNILTQVMFRLTVFRLSKMRVHLRLSQNPEPLIRALHQVLLPLQPGDVPDTLADVSDLARDLDFRPSTTVQTGIARFVDWYLDYYGDGDPTGA